MRNRTILYAGFASLALAVGLLAAPATLTTIYTFTDTAGDGGGPNSGFAIGAGGVMYGTTSDGGDSNAGTVYQLTPPASSGGTWTETVLYSFTGGSDGSEPLGGVVIGAGGVLYGATAFGGASGDGTVFSLTPPAISGNPWTEAVLHSFSGTDGNDPNSGVVIGNGGALYGVTANGGSADMGVVYAVTPGVMGGPWTEATIHEFTGSPDGQGPTSGLVIGAGDVLYGVTRNGGGGDPSCNHRTEIGCGIVYSLTPGAGGSWTMNTVLAFNGTTDSRFPAGLIMDSNGTLYGGMYGGVYELVPPASAGDAWSPTIIHNFTAIVYGTPYGLTMASNGTIYGLLQGTSTTDGTIFSLVPPASAGGTWAEHRLWVFGSSEDNSGGQEAQALTVTKSGNQTVVYGTTFRGPVSSFDQGIAFSLVP